MDYICYFYRDFCKGSKIHFSKKEYDYIMTKEVFLALIQKDIQELDMITKGLFETETLSPTIVKLASSKAQELVDNLRKLAQLKTEIILQHIAEENKIAPIIELTQEKEIISVETAIEIEEIIEEDYTAVTKIETLNTDDSTVLSPQKETESIAEKPIENAVEIEQLIEQKKEETVLERVKVQTETKIIGITKQKNDSFASTLANQKINDIKKAISIADRFRFQRELFTGDAEKMNDALTYINNCSDANAVQQYLSENFDWNKENETVEDFMNLINRLFA